jgi:hypothetical protein
MRQVYHLTHSRWPREAGIAIGPILFIIAILAILAAAIAAGSGSFNAPTSSESAKTKASALIEVGNNLKIGMDRMTMENSIAWGGWNIATASTVNNNDLFSPTGGGISPPSTSLAGTPGTDTWYYPTGHVPGLGTLNEDQLAVLNIASDVCTQVNNRANGIATPAAADLGDFSTASVNSATSANWPAALDGKTIGCVENSHGGNKFYFYEVLYVQ